MRERAEATEPRVCPQCKMKLWPRAKSRPLRFHELRHTFGSLLIMSGANLVSVQKLLGHSNPKITAETYAHFAPDYLLAEVNLLRFGVDYLAPIAKSSQRLPSQRKCMLGVGNSARNRARRAFRSRWQTRFGAPGNVCPR